MHYVYEFLGLMAVFSVLVVSPGADFLLVVRQSLVHGRRTAIVTSFGIGASLLFHIGYTILGIGIIVAKSLFLFGLLKWAGAAYLVYLGWKSLRADTFEMPDTAEATTPAAPPSALRASSRIASGWRSAMRTSCPTIWPPASSSVAASSKATSGSSSISSRRRPPRCALPSLPLPLAPCSRGAGRAFLRRRGLEA